MKRLFFTVVVALSAIACFAGEPQGGIFKHVGLGVSGGTNGISVELSSPVTRWVQVRAGLSFMPNFKLNTDADVEYSALRALSSLTYILCLGVHSTLPAVYISVAISS